MKKFTFANLIWLISFLLLISPTISAQEESEAGEAEPADTYLSLIATYTSNDTVVLTANLYIRNGRVRVDLQNAPVSFHVSGGDAAIEAGESITDSVGKAQVMIPVSLLPRDKDGMVTYTADFEGTDKYLSASEMFTSKPARLEVSFYEEDSVKFIRVTGTQFASNGEGEPLTDETISMFIPTLFRPMAIGEIWLEADGTGSMEFPMTLIGDSLGQLMVVARIDEHDTFGYVQGEGQSDWAIPKHLLGQDKPTRELWTPVAPIWMMITLLILLAGVWGHYVYAIVELVRIKKSAKKELTQQKNWSDYS
jgi:hypothetical protein